SDNVIGRLVETADSRRARLAIAGLVILLIMLAAPTRAFAQPLVVYDGPFVMTIPGPCVSTDVITLTGRMVMTFYGPLIRQPDGSGGMHTTFRTVVKAQGANNDPINPKKYVMNDEEVTDFNAPSGGTIDQTQVINQGV